MIEKTVIKRDGSVVDFDKNKIENAIMKAMKNGSGILKPAISKKIADEIDEDIKDRISVSITEIEEMVFDKLISKKQRLTARAYEQFRSIREFQRLQNTIDNQIIGLSNGSDKEILDENSNKNSHLISTKRDLTAEIVSKDISKRMKLPTHISQAHDNGLIYVHDLGHYLNDSFNCCLVNLKDMLENGTVINGKMIEPQKRFTTACTVASQIIAQVASGQFGGQTISLAHLSPFVRKTKDIIKNNKKKEWDMFNFKYTLQELENATIVDLKQEIKSGIQTIQYQVNTLQTSNGQSPFLSVLMYISEYPEYETETAMLIKEVLEQRIKGMQNEVGAWITPAFPKLLYVTDENNIYDDSEYYYLTELACKCVSKRMMPDFLSAKLLKENYEGCVIPPMGKCKCSPYKINMNPVYSRGVLYAQ